MDTKTCPHCNETALRLWSRDSWRLKAWECETCYKVFFTEKEDQYGNGG